MNTGYQTHALKTADSAEYLVPHARADLHLLDLVHKAHNTRQRLAALGGSFKQALPQDRVELIGAERVRKATCPAARVVVRPQLRWNGRQGEQRVKVGDKLLKCGRERWLGEMVRSSLEGGRIEEDNTTLLRDEEGLCFWAS